MKAPEGNSLKIKGKVKGIFLNILTQLSLCKPHSVLCFIKHCFGLSHQACSSFAKLQGTVSPTVMKLIAEKTKDLLMIKNLTIVRGCNVSVKFEHGISYW